MKLAPKLLVAALLLVGGFAIGSMTMTTGADSLIDPNQPGSANDPLVTKSYVDQQVRSLVAAELEKRQENLRSLVVVELNPGETLLAGEGAEFIVRNGKAEIVSPNPNGVPDITDGVDLRAGTIVPNQHLLLFPREDGRGIKPHSSQKDTIFVMVRGKYMHVDADGKPIPPK